MTTKPLVDAPHGERPGVTSTSSDIPTCPYCHLRFSSRNELLDHLNREHPDRGGRKG